MLFAAVLITGVGAADGARTSNAASVASVVDIKGSTTEWRDLLVEAVQKEGTTVRLGPDVDIDMSGLGPIYVARGVTLTSITSFGAGGKKPEPPRPGDKRPTEVRSPRALGPRLYTKSRPRPLFQVECFPDGGALNDNVHFSGFRLQGADLGSESGDDHLQTGIQIENCVGIEISNMELSGWSGQAIKVNDSPRFASQGRIGRPDQVKIHDNFIHNNQHIGGNGYGVDVSIGAYALIERNVFDFNRHAIAASGTSGGYAAERNLVLKGGGYHKLGFHTHIFDVHGDANCGLRGVVNDSAWNCGTAGEQLWYRENAFQYLNGAAIKIRGTPRIQAFISRNVFAHDRLDDGTVTSGAVALTQGKTHVLFGQGQLGNVTGFDPYGKYGVCDFDGDGKDDLFLATGVTWWFSSGGAMPWSYLNAATERLDQVKFGYFDNDVRCDVLAANGDTWEISSGGTAPWRALGRFGVALSDVVFGRFGGAPDTRAGQTRVTTHAFRRAADGQWFVTPVAAPNWQPAQSSSTPLSKLRFGDFTGDGITDVLAVQAGRWSISQSATGPWEKLNAKLGQDVGSLLVADVDNDNRDDLVRFQAESASSVTSWVSWGGRTDWVRLKTLGGLTQAGTIAAAVKIYPYTGRFDAVPGADVLLFGNTRIGHFLNKPGATWLSAYSY